MYNNLYLIVVTAFNSKSEDDKTTVTTNAFYGKNQVNLYFIPNIIKLFIPKNTVTTNAFYGKNQVNLYFHT